MQAASGHPLHTRSLTIVVRQGEPGRWRVRGDIIDLRKCGFVPMPQDLQPAGIIHHMTLDCDVVSRDLRLDALRSEQPQVAVEPSEWSRGECCRDPAPRLQALVGECFDRDFAKRLSSRFGGALGCSHLLTLFQLLAAALPRAALLERALAGPPARRAGEWIFRRSCFIDGLERDDASIALVLQLHDFHSRPGERFASPVDRLDRHEEVRVVAQVEPPAMKFSSLEAAERRRDPGTLADAAWRDRSGRLEHLAGEPIVPGLAGKLFAALGNSGDGSLLLEAVLQLAPAHIQVLAAVADRYFAAARGAAQEIATSSGNLAVASLGGLPDSCYMWRRGGPLLQIREQQRGGSDRS